MRNFYALLCIVGIAAIFCISGCNIINPPEAVPTYVHIDSFSFTGNTAVTGSNSHKITNAYVYFNNSPVGIFDLPVTFPVIMSQPGTLTVLPGIDFDGLTGYESIYSLYDGDTMHLVPGPGTIVNHVAATHYNSSVVPRFLEEFEQGSDNGFMKLSGDTGLVNTTSDVFEGSGSGLVHLIPGRDSATVISKLGKYIPPGKGAFIEMDYKSNMPLQVGVGVLLAGGVLYNEYLIGLKPRSSWGKIYIGIDQFVGMHQGLEYRLLFHTQKTVDVTDGYLYLDNIKVVSFK